MNHRPQQNKYQEHDYNIMNEIICSPAVKDDAERIAELLKYIANLHATRRPDIYRDGEISKFDKNGVEELISDPENFILTATLDGKVIGYTISKLKIVKDHAILRDRKVYYIDDFCVDPEIHRMGVGRKLMSECINDAKAKGCSAVELNVWEMNSEAKAFYEACGMKTQRRQMEMEI